MLPWSSWFSRHIWAWDSAFLTSFWCCACCWFCSPGPHAVVLSMVSRPAQSASPRLCSKCNFSLRRPSESESPDRALAICFRERPPGTLTSGVQDFLLDSQPWYRTPHPPPDKRQQPPRDFLTSTTVLFLVNGIFLNF